MMHNRRRRFTVAQGLTVLGLLVSLLFSVGEGLRLSPFHTLSQPAQVAAGHPEQALHVYGSVEVPAQVVKRTKRHSLDLDVTPVVDTFQFQEVALSFNETQLTDVATLGRSLRLGRAPPGLSYS